MWPADSLGCKSRTRREALNVGDAPHSPTRERGKSRRGTSLTLRNTIAKTLANAARPRRSRMRKNRTTKQDLPACVARCNRNSLRATAARRAPRTPRKCPPRIEIRPAIRLWYVQRIVSRLASFARSVSAAANLEKSRRRVATRLGPKPQGVCARNIISTKC